jgi:pimeloyl-ACP methyl ester carboxylesterase
MTLARGAPAIAHTSRGPIEYRRTGRGPAVLVLKGGHCSRDTRLGHERLADHGFTVIEPSRPGYDATPVSVGCTAQDAAAALVGLLDALDIDKAHVVAISAAGHTGIELARRHPERVDRISFECAVALPWPVGIRRGGRVLFGPLQAPVWKAMRVGFRLAPNLALRVQLSQLSSLNAARVVREMTEETRRQYLAVFRSLWSGRGFACDLEHDSPSPAPIPQPTLVMFGAHDPSVPPEHAARLADLTPDHERAELDAESHLIWFGRAADEVWERRLAFLLA